MSNAPDYSIGVLPAGSLTFVLPDGPRVPHPRAPAAEPGDDAAHPGAVIEYRNEATGESTWELLASAS